MSKGEKKRRRRAFLLALLSTALLTLFFLVLVLPPRPPVKRPTGYLVVTFDQGAPRPKAPKKPPAPAAPKPAPRPGKTPKPARVTATQPKPVPPKARPKPPAPRPKAKAPPKAPAPTPQPKPAPKAPKSPPAPARPAPAPKEKAKVPRLPETPKAPEGPRLPPPAPAPAAPPAPAEPPPGPEEAAAPPAPAPEPGEAAPAPEAPAAPVGEAPELPPALTGPSTPPGPASPPGAPPAPAPVPAPAPPSLAPAPPAPAPVAGTGKSVPRGPGQKAYELKLFAPLLVSVDNAHAAYPQTGLDLAYRVYEVPVEGGVTRLLVETRGGEKGRIGPVRSARMHILRLAAALDAILVHVGGSPAAQKAIEERGYVTFDGLYDNRRFVRDPRRRPPHNDYVKIGEARKELGRLGLDRVEIKKGAAYLPPADAPAGTALRVRFAPDYVSAFVFEGEGYRWVRNGQKTPFHADAVVVLFVKARVKDRVGRLSVDLSGGDGGLYLAGRYQPVRWKLSRGGFVLKDAQGRDVDLAPYRVWFVWVPPWARLE